MSNLKSNTFVDTVDHNISHGIKNNVLHLNASNTSHNTIDIEGRSLYDFSNYLYMRLERHPKLIEGGIEAMKTYGVQFGYSEAYVTLGLKKELEQQLSQVFGKPTIVAQSTTLAHQSVLPTIINDNDLLIVDQYAHASIQEAAKLLNDRGVKKEIVRHNRIDLIEKKILEHRNKHPRIWYLADGVYSMHGNYARINEIEHLLNKYKQFHFFVDDAHGMGWTGQNGRGYVLSQMELHEKMILITSMNKAYSASGGAIVVPNQEWYTRIKNCGGPLIFSTPIPPPNVGIGLASAKLHMTKEFKAIQEDLKSKIKFCRSILDREGIPEISQNDSPVFFIPCSLPDIAFNLSRLMLENGFYVTATMFPAVGSSHAGIRFCINVNLTIELIGNMVQLLKKLYYKVIADFGYTEELVLKHYKKLNHTQPILKSSKVVEEYKIEHFRSIHEINPNEWDNIFKNKGVYDYSGLQLVEQIFTDNAERHNNWEFFYIIIRDQNQDIVLATFLTLGLTKTDLFEQEFISKRLEKIRQTDPYYICSNTLMMGNQVSEGDHLYIKKDYDSSELIKILLREVTDIQVKSGAENIVLRDFDLDYKYSDILLDNGYVKFKLPADTHSVSTVGWDTKQDFLDGLDKSKKRQQIRTDVFDFEDHFEVQVLNKVSAAELMHFYDLYMQVKSGRYLINTFDLPIKFFEKVNEDEAWEMIVLSIKDNPEIQQPVGVVWCKKGDNIYTPLFIGLDYAHSKTYKVYKQAMWQMILRAKSIGKAEVLLGVTASLEKRRFGAKVIEKEAYLLMNDTFDLDLLHSQGFKDLDHDLLEQS